LTRTHSVLRQHSSQLQKHLKQWSKTTQRYEGQFTTAKHQAARMSRRIAVEQKRYATDTQCLQFETC